MHSRSRVVGNEGKTPLGGEAFKMPTLRQKTDQPLSDSTEPKHRHFCEVLKMSHSIVHVHTRPPPTTRHSVSPRLAADMTSSPVRSTRPSRSSRFMRRITC